MNDSREEPRTIGPADPEWPRPLDECDFAPQRLFVKGRRLERDAACVAIVGTRYPTAAGAEVAAEIAGEIAQAGYVVVSGLAIGIDAIAHRASLDASGRTIAVVGAGLDVDYPQRNRTLRRDIERSGTVLSEYPTGTEPRPYHFPARNRIIAGMSVATVVIEGGIRSGALITARYALDANRAVFAVPGSVRNAMAVGPNELIKRCEATPLTCAADLFEELAPGSAWAEACDVMDPSPPPLDREEFQVVSCLDDTGVLPAQIAAITGLPHGRVGLMIARLEVRGLVARDGAGFRVTTAGARLRAQLSLKTRRDAED